MTSARKIIAGNWKMNGLRASLPEAGSIQTGAQAAMAAGIGVILCPPTTLIAAMDAHLSMGLDETRVGLGGQDCHMAGAGAHTGDISAEMLKEAGATYVILGHSERRADHAETSHMIARKAEAAFAKGLVPIICVGESEAERDAGTAYEIVLTQLEHSIPETMQVPTLVVAYEPVWAIGTGRVPEMEDIAAMHAAIRQVLVVRFGAAGQHVSILYGGSVKAANADDILSVTNVDGALVGGASLKASDFLPIIEAAQATLRSS